MIDDQAVEKSIAEEAEAKAETAHSDLNNVVSDEVTDKLQVRGNNIKKLYEELDFDKGSMDRLLCYEVTGMKLDGDDFDSDSDDSDESASSSSDGDGDSLLLRSPSRGVGAPYSRSGNEK